MNRKTFVVGLALTAVTTAVTTAGALPALSADRTATAAAPDHRGPEEPKDKDKDKDKKASPSPSPEAPAADETGCRNVTGGGASWIRPVTLPGGQGEVPLGSGLIAAEITLEQPSCPEVTYTFIFHDSEGATELFRQTSSGSGEQTIRLHHLLAGYEGTCLTAVAEVSETVNGFQVVHDSAPDAPAEICDKGVPGSGSGGQVWR